MIEILKIEINFKTQGDFKMSSKTYHIKLNGKVTICTDAKDSIIVEDILAKYSKDDSRTIYKFYSNDSLQCNR